MFELDVKADRMTVTMQDNSGGKLKARTENTVISMSGRSDFKGVS
ncbi:hypothetical protein [uncultured Dokdonia sp.]|nr:hypothetical protein [uncultured Dokdonia sp.]